MPENVFSELKRYVRFGEDDEAWLSAFAPRAAPHCTPIIDAFYARIQEHEPARKVLRSPEQVGRLKRSLHDWLLRMLEGPWDAGYSARRLRIGRVHVQIALPQQYMFGAIDLIRLALAAVVDEVKMERAARAGTLAALHKILDIELALMLESYREAYVEQLQQQERQERSELQRRLELSEARYEEIVEKAEILVTTLDVAGRIVLFNAKCEELLGRSRAEARGESWLELFAPAADHALVRAVEARAMSGESVQAYEATVPGLDRKYCRVRWQFTTLPGGAGSLVCAIGIDVSREHELAVQTRRSERLAALGTMAAGLAHEIRNPLNAARLQLSLAERRLERAEPEADTARSAVQLAQNELQRLSALVQDFLEFARPQPLRLVEAELRGVVMAVLSRLASDASRRGVTLQLEPGVGIVLEFDLEKIKQLLTNLVCNALEASRPGGHVNVCVAVEESAALIIVRDDGPGMPPDAPIFEPFFTTKEFGTGLGLAIAHRIVLDHGGQIMCRSQPADTQFRIILPGVASR